MINDSELILNQDGSVYHLNLLPEDIADTIIFVGDQERVPLVSRHFDDIEIVKGKREFITHTGHLRGKRISVVSTGIGTDNIDIVINEIDALFNVDLQTKVLNSKIKSVDIIRIGTSGSMRRDIEIDQIIVSEFAVGFDSLMQFYKKQYTDEEIRIREVVTEAFATLDIRPYVGKANESLLEKYAHDLPRGITVTAPGFYGPQGRKVRTQETAPQFIEVAGNLAIDGRHITNLEMETAGIYALSNMFGHRAISINAILASRVDTRFSEQPQAVIERAIELVLERF
ncbi:nucleoside phosphorylase [Sphingobacterium sp. lm-10]|uniref:nucleoside phosphorylase n=1 Tax=Sphingobacterium sp. lm-10 TaxID=2944904 RepID=UPI00202290CD|nr:nucleoside phosphorylase [Sphingobacterium sp. lm-10]MCL7987705.1 nucleoside phosphorylase [Sphingobacterium sp. lm-10]